MIEPLLAAENLLALGLLDQAERTYRQVLAADPRNAIAAVGLSRVALERGDETSAIALAHDALAIDPENATARRMIDRLEEVARYREAATVPPDAAPAQSASQAAIMRATTPAPGATVPATTPAPGATVPATTPAPAVTPATSRRGLLRRLLGRT